MAADAEPRWRADADAVGGRCAEPGVYRRAAVASARANHAALAVDRQQSDPDSLLAFTRTAIALRRDQPALRTGDIAIVTADEALLVLDRCLGGQRLRCSFNLSAQAVPFAPGGRNLISTGDIGGNALGPFAALIEDM